MIVKCIYCGKEIEIDFEFEDTDNYCCQSCFDDFELRRVDEDE